MPDIYIFNLSGASIAKIAINSLSVSGVPLKGWGPALPYEPVSLGVPRSSIPANLNPNPAFSQAPEGGANLVYIAWANNNYVTFTVLPSLLETQILEDYLLYVAPSQSILFDQFGTWVQTYHPTVMAITS
jgi:hypothetical protein